jgi:hypothetical protein
MLLLKIPGIGILGLIAWQDLTKKAIYWIVFPAGFIVFFIMGILRMDPAFRYINELINDKR